MKKDIDEASNRKGKNASSMRSLLLFSSERSLGLLFSLVYRREDRKEKKTERTSRLTVSSAPFFPLPFERKKETEGANSFPVPFLFPFKKTMGKRKRMNGEEISLADDKKENEIIFCTSYLFFNFIFSFLIRTACEI
jgi:hypothetical protein